MKVFVNNPEGDEISGMLTDFSNHMFLNIVLSNSAIISFHAQSNSEKARINNFVSKLERGRIIKFVYDRKKQILEADLAENAVNEVFNVAQLLSLGKEAEGVGRVAGKDLVLCPSGGFFG